MVAKVEVFLNKACRVTLQEVANQFGSSKALAHQILHKTKKIGLSRVSARSGIRLQGDWGEIVTLEGSKSPWEALRATKTSPSIFATFEKANTCAQRTFLSGEIQ